MICSSKISSEHCTEETHGNVDINEKRVILTTLQPEQDCNTKNNCCSKYTSNTKAVLPKVEKHDTSLPMVSEEERQEIYKYIYVKKHEPKIIVTSKDKIWTNADEIINEDTNLKGVYSENYNISSPDCRKEKSKEPSSDDGTGSGDINFEAVMDSSSKQVSEIEKNKNDAFKSHKNVSKSNDEINKQGSTTKPDVSNQQNMGVMSKQVNIKKTTNPADVQSSLCNREVTKNQDRNSYKQSQKKETRNRNERDEKFQFNAGLHKVCELLTKTMFRLVIISSIVSIPIAASCTLKITSIELEPPDILLYVNVSKDCDFKGVSKWEGGPDNTLLTFGNQSKHKNYQPVQRGRTFDLLIRNATLKEYNARYNFHLKFKNISAYLPTLPVYPGKGCFQTHCHVMGETLVVEVHVKAFPEPFFEILFASMNLTEKQEKKLTKKKLFYEGNVNFTYQLPEKSCDGQLNINYYLGAVHGNLFQKVINGCTKSGSYTEAIVVPIVSLLVIMAIGIFICKNKFKEKCCTKNTEHPEEESVQLNGIKITNE